MHTTRKNDANTEPKVHMIPHLLSLEEHLDSIERMLNNLARDASALKNFATRK